MVSLTRRELLASAATAAALPAAGRPKTNVIFILTDDHGAWAMNAYGCSDMHTPNLDRLAADGARFTRAYACTPVCSPSRVTYLTGRLPSHDGVQDWLINDDCVGPTARPFLRGQPTISETLVENGYTAGLSGKWHMGDDERAQAGFSYWSTVPGGGGTYRDPTFVKNGQHIKRPGYKTDHVGDDAIEFITLNKDRPFFLYLAFFAPHAPYDYQPEAYRRFYGDSKFPCFPNEPIHPWHTRTMFGRPFPTLKDFNNRESKLSYSSLVTGMDHNVGRVVRCLEELKLRDKTLIVFTADQGHCCGHHGIWGKGNSTWPFNMYDTSLHVPLIWNLPGRIRAGQILPPMVSSYDFFPTLVDYLDIAPPNDPKRVGRSYAAFLRGQSQRWQNELYFEYEYVRGIRTENLKLVHRTAEWPSEFYDLEKDPGERRNVIDDPRYSSDVKALRARMESFFDRVHAPRLEDWRSTTQQQLPEYGR